VSTLLQSLGIGGDRLSPLDASFLYLEQPHELLHVGAVAVLDGRVPFESLVQALGARLAGLRRYRQRPVRPFLDLNTPAWEDDPDYDPRRHIQRVELPAPGGERELHRVVDDLFAQPLDARRPLWETHLIDGLDGGRAALLTKVHHCMIDGVSGVQVLDVMTDPARGAASAPRGPESPALPVERNGGLVPLAALGRSALAGLRSAVATAAQIPATLGAAATIGTLARQPVQVLPFNGPLTAMRQVVWTPFRLDDFLAMRGMVGCKVNDVVLAVITGALRLHLAARGVSPAGCRVRTLVPVNVRRRDEHLTLGNRVSGMLACLPVDVDDPVERLHRIAEQMRGLKEQGQQRAFDLVLGLAGTAPAPIMTLLGRIGGRWPLINTVCTNVPGSREPRYVLGRRVVSMHPIVPLALGIGLGFAILSYAGEISICATADPSLVPNADRLPEALTTSMRELRERLGTPEAARAVRPAIATGPAVGDLMTRDVATLAPHDTLARAWQMMRLRRIRHLPVVDDHGHLLGVVTHRDLLAASQSTLSFRTEDERVRLLAWARADDVMETHLSTAAPDEPAAEAGRRMVHHKIGCLPVVEGGERLVGIITEEDFLHWATEHMGCTAA
jgi:diacylglycerol O-acyltransferase / wax synthase